MPRISKPDLIRLQKKLKTDQAIAEKFNITRQYVHQMRQLYGIPSSLIDNAGRNNKIIAMYKKGMTGAEIAKKVGLTVFYVYKLVGYAGVRKNAVISNPRSREMKKRSEKVKITKQAR